MLKIISRLILLVKGWTYNVDALKTLDKCVLIVAPHTSAWDMAKQSDLSHQKHFLGIPQENRLSIRPERPALISRHRSREPGSADTYLTPTSSIG